MGSHPVPVSEAARRGRRLALLLIGGALSATLSTRVDAQAPKLIRLVDTDKAYVRTIDGELKRTLPPFQARHAFQLGEVPAQPHLRFSIGLSPADEKQRMRFEVVLLQPKGSMKNLYSAELDAPGWVDVDLDLSNAEIGGAQLLLNTTMVEGKNRYNAVWGEPILLPGTGPADRSVILISIDTLRADHVGVYGYEKARTPVLDALARNGVWYTAAYSASTWTYPSHASLLDGVYPTALLPLGVKPRPDTDFPQSLAHWFGDAGYLTAGFTGGGFLSDKFGFPAAFDTYYMFAQPAHPEGACPEDRLDGPQVFARARRWLSAVGSRPFFLFVHTYEVHDRCPVWPAGIGPFADWPNPGPAGRERLISYYDTMLSQADALVGGLLSELDKLGLADRTIIVVTGDHGEAFWEHGFYGHGCPREPYEPLIHVPLILRVPDEKRHGPIDQPVSAVDVAPTVLALAGLPRPPIMQGYVLPGLGLDGRPQAAPVYVHCENQLAVRIGDHKLITARDTPAADQLFDVKRDPEEKRNLIADDPAVAQSLRAQAAAYRSNGWAGAGRMPTDGRELDEPTRERLRALGYLQ